MRLTRKQKILITVIIIAVAFLLWQLYNMFGGGSETETQIAPSVAPIQSQPVIKPTSTSTTVPVAIPPSSQTVKTTQTAQVSTPSPTPIPTSMTLIAPLTPQKQE